MRRFIAYLTMAASMLVAVGVSATPVLTKMNSGREFSSGRELTFKISSKDESVLPNNASEIIAEEMRTRLDNFNLEDYSVKVQGNDMVTASFSCEANVFNYVAKYLNFSGEHFGISGSDPTTYQADLFDLGNVRIVQYNDLVPFVVIPLKGETEKTALEQIITTSTEGEDNSETEKSFLRKGPMEVSAHDEEGNPTEGEEEEEKEPDLFLWANYEEGDSYTEVYENPYIHDRLLLSFYSEQLWYTEEEGSTADEHMEIKFVCGETNENNEYDFTKLKDANLVARYYKNMLTASEYDFVVECPTVNVTMGSGFDYYTNAVEVEPSIESLISLTDTDVNLAVSRTLIATLVAFCVVSLIIAVFYRMMAVAIVSTTISSVYLTYVAFIGMGALFNIPAIIGGIILVAGTLISEITYVNRFRDEVYKGRALKKANQEASKKSNLFTVDATVILMFGGLMTYLLGGVALKPMGVILFFGGLISLVMNLLVFKFFMYLLTNASGLQNNLKLFGLNDEKVPNLMAEQKPSRVAPFENTDFTKRAKLSSVVFGVLTVAAVAVITIFGIKDGSPLNVRNATAPTTVVYSSLRSEELASESSEDFKLNVLNNVEIDGSTLEFKNVEMKTVTTYNIDTELEEKVFYFIANIDQSYSEDQLETISNTINDNIVEYYGLSSESVEVLARNSQELIYTPNQGLVALATGITIAGVALYVCFRYRASRGLALMITSAGSTAISYGLFVAIHVGTTAVTSLAMPVVAISTMLLSLFYLSTEKQMFKDSKEELTADVRNEIMKKALSKSAWSAVVFTIIALYFAINYFGFGISQTALLFLSILFGEVVGCVSLYAVNGSLGSLFEKMFANIHLPKFKKAEKKEHKVQVKQRSSEPEETIFIGIND